MICYNAPSQLFNSLKIYCNPNVDILVSQNFLSSEFSISEEMDKKMFNNRISKNKLWFCSTKEKSVATENDVA